MSHRARLNPWIHFLDAAEEGGEERRRPSWLSMSISTCRSTLMLQEFGIVTRSSIIFEAPKPPAVLAPAPAPMPEKSRPVDRFHRGGVGWLPRRTEGFHLVRTVLCVTHVPPYPSCELRERVCRISADSRLSRTPRLSNRDSSLPLPGEEISSEQFRAICNRFPYTILCGSRWRGAASLARGPSVTFLWLIEDIAVSPLAPELGEDLVDDPRMSAG